MKHVPTKVADGKLTRTLHFRYLRQASSWTAQNAVSMNLALQEQA